MVHFTPPPVLTTARLRLEPLGPEHIEGTWTGLENPESMRLTGTHAEFTRPQVESWLAGLAATEGRADWAIILVSDGSHIGEVVLNDYDAENSSLGFRIALNADSRFGQGYGTEATRAVVRHAFDVIGVHRIGLEVYAFNPRAQRAYEKCGFRVEGRLRDALLWNGERIDAVVMGMLATDPRP
ncbi:GNAT family protein [Arthrobacter tumbae]|uniref:GNAT family N-acetyltransferase n=1 Tax=Arthrobacter tumbae TaxID=163874 RepID=UPI00195BFEC4|nr:GNAT family protein [Arthrobacter tumbae]MBM7782368.1 RimJ/RimL family protein N-acetyltransferase [Arthrobacter tumbae]